MFLFVNTGFVPIFLLAVQTSLLVLFCIVYVHGVVLFYTCWYQCGAGNKNQKYLKTKYVLVAKVCVFCEVEKCC